MDAAADNAVNAAPSLGQALAAERERQGLSRADVAQRLHMSAYQVEALEMGDYGRLPKGTFLRGFVRNYAKVLGIPPESVLSQLAETAPPEPAPRIVVPTQNIRFDPIGDRLANPYVKATVLAAVAVAVAFAVMYWWLFMRDTAPTTVHKPAATNGEAVTVAPSQPAVPAPEVPPANPPVAPPPVATPPASGAPSSMPAKTEPAKPEVAKADAAKADAPRTAAAAQGGSVLRFHFEAESWVEVRDARDKVLFQQLNPAGSDAEVRGRPPLAVIVGNAHSVRLTYNDKRFPLDPHTKVDVARFTLE